MSANQQKPKIVCLPNGPYYLLNDLTPAVVPHLRRANGEPCASVRGVALCRCGGSKNKPFCDGTHGTNGFTDQNVADRSQNRRVNYVGKRLTIHDNRAICAHAGICTDSLETVYRSHQEPWIDPDGASVEKIIETIKRCPSGALSYSPENVEPRDQDRSEEHTSELQSPTNLVCR